MSTTKDLRLARFVKTLHDIGFGALIFIANAVKLLVAIGLAYIWNYGLELERDKALTM